MTYIVTLTCNIIYTSTIYLSTYFVICLFLFIDRNKHLNCKLEHSRRREMAFPVLILSWCHRSQLKTPFCTSTYKFKGSISSKLNIAALLE